jgi:spore maturation protein SpmA
MRRSWSSPVLFKEALCECAIHGDADGWKVEGAWARLLELASLSGSRGARTGGRTRCGMLNYIWLGLIVLGALLGGFQDRMREVVDGAIDGAQTAVTLAIGLIGVMALWLGAMRLAEKAGLVRVVARVLQPLLKRLFPDVPVDHPAMGSMVMNIAANMLGLNNAATPLGLRAMRDLEQLNPIPGTATNAMCTFLAINTSSVQLIPMTAVAVLAAAGAHQPSAIIGTAFLATLCSTIAGLTAVKTLERLPFYRPSAVIATPRHGNSMKETRPESSLEMEDPDPTSNTITDAAVDLPALSTGGWVALVCFLGAFGWFFLAMTIPDAFGLPGAASNRDTPFPIRAVNALSLLAIPFLMAVFPLYAALRQVSVYEEFVEGAKEGFRVGVRIIPYLVAMLVAVGMFRGGGGIEVLSAALGPVLDLVQFPTELLPMALIRPLTGSGTLAVFSELAVTHGPDSLIARMAGTLFGSTETTFYVIVLYFGAVGVRKSRHAVPAGLIADATGVIAAVVICRWVFGA